MSRLSRGGLSQYGRSVFVSVSQVARFSRPALVNGAVGLVTVTSGELFSVMGFTIKGGKIVEIDILADAARLAHST